ncbi:methyltransferase [Patulibacter sp.]|uniref:class I SAM-dependent methyltransferase n=1 Tax=Patulibacter sp. TaxID=1912859 RepID=UPI002717159A|nr:methyltransferase domain-containing protein [Patulibacter sp.]MDO9408014.1 methyltransferase domain-containing protein [Patulibacter sp.]
MPGLPPPSDLVAEHVVLGDVELDVRRPRDLEALVDADAFADGEFLPYWAALWPSAPALAELLADRLRPGDRVLELGCGLALPSLVAARLGAEVTASDWAPAALELLADNAERNDVRVEPLRLDWFAGADGVGAGDRWPLVLAADVLYESRNGPALLATLDRVVAPGGEAWIADPGRPPGRRFWPLAEATWTVEVLGTPASGAPVVRRLRRRTAREPARARRVPA